MIFLTASSNPINALLRAPDTIGDVTIRALKERLEAKACIGLFGSLAEKGSFPLGNIYLATPLLADCQTSLSVLY